MHDDLATFHFYCLWSFNNFRWHLCCSHLLMRFQTALIFRFSFLCSLSLTWKGIIIQTFCHNNVTKLVSRSKVTACPFLEKLTADHRNDVQYILPNFAIYFTKMYVKIFHGINFRSWINASYSESDLFIAIRIILAEINDKSFFFSPGPQVYQFEFFPC